MNEPKDRCPTPDLLRRLLAEELLSPEIEAVANHIEHCADCQQTLERLTDSSRSSPTCSAGEAARPALLQKILGARGASAAERPGEDRRSEAEAPTNSEAKPAPPQPVEAAALAVETVGSLIGPYKLLQPLGQGGMGAVWVAEQLRPVKRRVALKVIKPGMDSEKVVHRFEAERQALALMDHPNIAKVFDAGTTGSGRPYFVMELVHGVPITQYCDELNLPIRERLELCLGVCRAVGHAHQKGIIHRDIKPSNTLVALQEGRPLAKVIDFGVAKALHQRLTEATVYTEFGAIVGTLEYMSPEQAEMSPLGVDTRTDVYGLGVLLYELLTGSTPLDRNRLQKAAYSDVVRIIREEEPPRPSTRLTQSRERLTTLAAQRRCAPELLRQQLRGELDWIVMKCLEKDRTRRYESVSALAHDLESYLEDRPVLACPPSKVYLARKFIRRHRGAVAVALLTVGLLLAGIVGTTWGLLQAQRALARADAAAQEERQARAAETVQRRRAEEQQRVAEENERRAVAERQIADAVRTFLQQDLLRQASAVVQANAALKAGRRSEATENPTIKELLDRAAGELTPAKINRKFPNQPEVQASILTTVGTTYESIGRYPQAVEFLTRAHETTRAAFGADDPRTVTALSSLALAYRRVGKEAEAAALLEQVHEWRARHLGPEDPQTIETLVYLGTVYRTLSKFTEAVATLEQASALRAKQMGPEHQQTLNVRGILVWTYMLAGEKTRAVALLEEIRAAQVKRLGKEHPDTLTTVNNLALAYTDAGRPLEAIALLEPVRARREKAFGATHPETINTLEALAEAHEAAGDLRAARRVYEQAARAIEQRDFQYSFTGVVLDHLSGCLEKLQQFEEAETWRRRLLEVTRTREGPGSVGYALALTGLGRTLLLRKKYGDAEVPLREALTLLRQQQPDDWRRFAAESLLGGVLLGQQKYPEAEARLREGYQGLKEHLARIPPLESANVTETVDRLVQLYEAQGKAEEAAKWRQQRQAQGRSM